jgi:Flp pilus assembly protein TadG
VTSARPRPLFFRPRGKFRGRRGITGALACESGTASLEFLSVGLLLLVPVVYLIVALSALQAGALAVEGAARQAARSFVLAATSAEGAARAERAVILTLADYGVDPATADIAVSCTPEFDSCLHRRSLVTVEVAIRVPLPLVPPVLELDVPLSIPMTATSTQLVSRFWRGD